MELADDKGGHTAGSEVEESEQPARINPPAAVRLEPLKNIPHTKTLMPLPPLSKHPVHPDMDGRFEKTSTRVFDMERQTSKSPLVDSCGLDESQTSLELNANLKASGIKRKGSQVHPIKTKEDEARSNSSTDSVAKSNKKCTGTTVGKVIVSLVVGIWFGWFLQKSSVYKPQVIRNQFLFKEFIMLKTFLAALLSSQLCILILSVLPPTKIYMELARQAFTNSFSQKGVISTLIGSFILGSGMAVAGACPGMVLAQNGSLVPNSAYTTLGGLLACLIYGFVHKYIAKLSTPAVPYSTQYVHEKLKVPFVALAVPCMIFCLAAITLMEVFIPENEESRERIKAQALGKGLMNDTMEVDRVQLSLSTCKESDNWFTQEMWSPSTCGVMIGLVQVPIVLLLTDTMGSSSGYQTITSQWVATKNLQEKFPYFANARKGLQNFWMVAYIIGAAIGAAFAAISSCSFFGAAGAPWWQALLGGFLMLFGSRLGSGCTSGHGISGAALLGGLSWLAVPVMFAGGISTAFIMEYSQTNFYVDKWEPEL